MPNTKTVKVSKSYHHGNVREAALAEVRRVLSDAYTRDFTLPQIAKAVGVSHAALYRHFNGKAGLLAALAIEGYQCFGEALNQAIHGQTEQALLRATAVAYCAFARAKPALFRAMFHPLLRDKSKFPELEAQAAASFQSLGSIVKRLGANSAIQGSLVSAMIWSSLHGIAALESDAWLPGRTGLEAKDLEKALPETLADVLFAGYSTLNDDRETKPQPS